MTPAVAQSEAAKTLPPSRPRWRLHASTIFVGVVLVAGLGVANRPFHYWHNSHYLWYSGDVYDATQASCSRAGWPWSYFKQPVHYVGIESPTNPHSWNDSVVRFDPAAWNMLALFGDTLIGFVLTVLCVTLLEARRRRRHRLIQLSLADLLGLVTVIALGCGAYRSVFLVANRSVWLVNNDVWESVHVFGEPVIPTVIHCRLPVTQQERLVRHYGLGVSIKEGKGAEAALLLEQFRDLRYVAISGSDVSDSHVAFLKDRPDLEALNLDFTAVGDETLAWIARLPRLRLLSLSNTHVTDHGLQALAHLKSLEVIDLCETEIGDPGLEPLVSLPNLKVVALRKTRITDDGVRKLAKFGSLQNLDLSYNKFLGEGFEAFAEHNQLEKLSLRSCTISRLHLQQMKSLTTLEMPGDTETILLNDLASLEQLEFDSDLVGELILRHLPALKSLMGEDSQIEKLEIDPTLPLGSLQLHYYEDGDAILRVLAKMKTLGNLDLDDSHVTDAGVNLLAGHCDLQTLSLENNLGVTDKSWPVISKLRNLEKLEIHGTAITRVELVGFPNLGSVYFPKKLARLRLSNLPVLESFGTECDDVEVSGVPALSSLGLAGKKAEQITRQLVQENEGFRFLDFTGYKLDASLLTALQRHQQLWRLNFTDSSLSNQDIKQLANFPNLELLDVDGTVITDEAIPDLQRLPSLKYLNAGRTKLSAAGVQALNGVRVELSPADAEQ